MRTKVLGAGCWVLGAGCWVLGAGCGVLGALAQATASRTVLATISDDRNRSIVDVGVDDFVVREAGQPREVLDVHMADYPVVVLVDNGAAGHGDFDTIRRAAGRFITRIGMRPVVLGTTANPPALVTTFDDSRETLLAKLSGLASDRSGESQIVQSVAVAARTLQSLGSAFSAIVVISSGAVDTTREPPGELLTTILDSGAILHVISKRPPIDRGPAGFAVQYRDLLRSLAEETRGQFTAIYSAPSYAIALDRLADRLAAEVMIQYIVPPGAARTDDVKLGVKLPGARVHGLGVK